MTPALRKVLDTHRQRRAEELYEIAELLERDGLTTDAGPLRTAATQCLSDFRTAGPKQPDAGDRYWGYEIEGLQIRLETQRHCRPRQSVMKDASGFLSVTVQEYLPPDSEAVGSSYSLLRRLDTDFYFDAHQVVDGAELPLRAAWHVDTHLHTATPSDSVHPRFHFQVGGERLDHLDADIRGIFVPETPRMPCPPMDGLLAVDFVLAHYCGSDWAMLREVEPRYARLRHAPIQRYWDPYFQIISEGIARLDTDPAAGPASFLIPSIFSA